MLRMLSICNRCNRPLDILDDWRTISCKGYCLECLMRYGPDIYRIKEVPKLKSKNLGSSTDV